VQCEALREAAKARRKREGEMRQEKLLRKESPHVDSEMQLRRKELQQQLQQRKEKEEQEETPLAAACAPSEQRQRATRQQLPRETAIAAAAPSRLPKGRGKESEGGPADRKREHSNPVAEEDEELQRMP
jgi:hypothetical protein